MFPGMVSDLFLYTLLTCSLVQASKSANSCSFVRTYKNQECTYNIYLTHEHSDSDKAPERLVMDTQNDYAEKINTMEKHFSFLKDEHEKRLKDLEGTLRSFVGSDKVETLPQATSNTLQLKGAAQNTRVLDDTVLRRLQDEFSKLRSSLKEKTEHLFDTQLKVNETNRLLEQMQVDMFTVNQDLLNAENKIALLERERAVLKNQVKDRTYKIDVSFGRLTECENKLSSQQDQQLTLIRSVNTLSEELATCQLVLNKTRVEMEDLESRHKELKARNHHTKQVLSIRERELIDCYSAKTETFCGFEDPNLCGFTQPNDTSDFFDWEWGKGSTPSTQTGPSADHTCQTNHGHFMFIEASAKGRGKNAIIYSPLYRGLVEQCLEFYYHMYGRHIGTLNVYAKARGAELASVWRAFGNQGDLWSVARLAIPKELARAGYQIAFEGITEHGYMGDMAIDDVRVTDGPCPIAEGIQAVLVQFNSTSVIDSGKNFARNIRRNRLGRIQRMWLKDGLD